ncbi:hypothetical protein V9T40_003995 [Parthenolecanium corni]|uniref:Ribosomal protein/NADH dehydrogenase domain-containing protein n=1 Tax=Parthenolecanium corni TaxID=536013 RepID=A0AAN9TEA8_9HEMI
MIGRNPVIRTKRYLEAGRIYLSDKIKVFSAHYNNCGERHRGLIDFCIWHYPQIQYKNPDVQCIILRNMTPTPFIRVYLENGDDVLIDVDSKDRLEILNHVIKVLGKPEKFLKEELIAKEKKDNPANFGYLCEKPCICKFVGQVPCSGVVPNCFTKRRKSITETIENETDSENAILYGLDDVPPWYLSIFMALQHYMTMISAIVSIPFVLTPALCMTDDDPAKSYIISTMIFVTSFVTFIQVTFGCRLPLVQGGTISFLIPTLAILSQPQWQCPPKEVLESMSPANQTETWQLRMREVSGAIILSASVQMFMGYFGVIGVILRFVSPLTIVPVISLAGLSLFANAADASSSQWGIAILTIVLLTVFSQCLNNVSVPVPSYNKKSGWSVGKFYIFKLFPVLLTIVFVWVLSGILTAVDFFPKGHPARTDVKLKIIERAAWIRIPYPFQWGWPTFSLSSAVGMFAGVLACTVESLGYYPTVAKMCGGPPPSIHVINRGVGTEGLGTVLAGIWGCGNGTNTFGENVGTIGVTKVGSRRVIQVACLIMLFQGVFNKFGAFFIIIPEPIIGGIFCVMFGMITAYGLSALQYVDLNSSRNLFILGFTFVFSLALPRWMIHNPGAIQTGFPTIDSVLTVLGSTSILIGGVLGCVMDNLIPGTLEERGVTEWIEQMKLGDEENEDGDVRSPYDFPFGMDYIRSHKWCSYIPCFPTYKARQ